MLSNGCFTQEYGDAWQDYQDPLHIARFMKLPHDRMGIGIDGQDREALAGVATTTEADAAPMLTKW
jgi:hypothetical protein